MAVYQGRIVSLEPLTGDALLSLTRNPVVAIGATPPLEPSPTLTRIDLARTGLTVEEKRVEEKANTPRQLPLEISWKRAISK